MKPEVIIDWVFTNEPRCHSHSSTLTCSCCRSPPLWLNMFKISAFPRISKGFFFLVFVLSRATKCSSCFCFLVVDLRQELAVRERQSDVSRMSAPSSPTQDNVKMDTAVQASLSLPATPLSKGLDNAFANSTGSCRPVFARVHFFTLIGDVWAAPH